MFFDVLVDQPINLTFDAIYSPSISLIFYLIYLEVKTSYCGLPIYLSIHLIIYLEVKTSDCGEIGLYGGNQQSWYLTEQGLKFNDSADAKFTKVCLGKSKRILIYF